MLQQVGMCSAKALDCSEHLLNVAVALLEHCVIVFVKELSVNMDPFGVYRAV